MIKGVFVVVIVNRFFLFLWEVFMEVLFRLLYVLVWWEFYLLEFLRKILWVGKMMDLMVVFFIRIFFNILWLIFNMVLFLFRWRICFWLFIILVVIFVIGMMLFVESLYWLYKVCFIYLIFELLILWVFYILLIVM